MASKAITYVWKIPRPTIDKAAMDLMGAAYQTATKTDPNVTTVLIRFVPARNKEPYSKGLT